MENKINDFDECHNVTLRSYRVIDNGTAAAAVECFTDKAVVDRYGDVSIGRHELVSLFTARQNDTDRVTCHAVVNYAHIDVIPGECSEAHYSVLVFQNQKGAGTQFVGVRTCLDRYLKQKDRWVIDYRRQRDLGAHLHDQLIAG